MSDTTNRPTRATQVPVRVPAARCCAPYCGDKIKGMPEADRMHEIEWSDGSRSYLHLGCEREFVEGATGYAGPDMPGWGPVPGLEVPR
jgi:hypothetical protein